MCVLPATDADACVPEFVPAFVIVLMLDDDTEVLPLGALLDCDTLALADDCVAPALLSAFTETSTPGGDASLVTVT
jgi:hypothetical protein